MFRRLRNRPARFSDRPEFRAIAKGIASAVAAMILAGCGVSRQDNFSYPSFYPGNEKIIFTYTKVGEPSTLVTYDLVSNRHHIHERQKIDPDDRYWGSGSVSDDGRKIVFSIGQEGTYNSQLAIMNVDGTGLRKITNSPGLRAGPSFSPDGRRIIYLFASGERRSPRRPVIGLDVFEIDIATGKETRLTDYEFYSASKPSYLPDGESFIFSGDGTAKIPIGSYEKQYQNNTIFVMKKNSENKLIPFIQRRSYSNNPSISSDGSKILFTSISYDRSLPETTYPETTYDLFIWNRGEITQLTRGQIVSGSSISPDGSRVVFVKGEFGRNPKRTLWVMNSDGSDLTEIPFPPTHRASAP